MLYIHSLRDFNSKSADIESLTIIRDLKTRTRPPFTEEQLWQQFAVFFVSGSDKDAMAASLQRIGPTVQEIRVLMNLNNPAYELINLQRAITMLEELPRPLINNLVFAEEIAAWQEEFIKIITPILNAIPQARTVEEKKALDAQLNLLFHKILRNDQFTFYAQDIVHEGQVSRVNDLKESLAEGFFFHITLQEHLGKADFSVIKRRIPLVELEPVEHIEEQVFQIKQGIERAYEVNMRMVNWAITLYSYVKWMLSS